MANDPTAVERLALWLERTTLTQGEAAELIDIDPTQFSQILNRKRRPGLDNAARIERKTGIPASAWASIDVDESEDAEPVLAKRTRIGKA